LLSKSYILFNFWTLFGLGLLISKKVRTVLGLGLSFETSGLDLDRKIWQSAQLCCSL